MSIKKQRLIAEIAAEIATVVAIKVFTEAASGLGYYLQIWLIVPVVQAQQGLRISSGMEFAQIKLIQTELVQTELVQIKLIQTKLMQTELMWTELVWTKLIQTKLIQTELVQTKLIQTKLVQTELNLNYSSGDP